MSPKGSTIKVKFLSVVPSNLPKYFSKSKRPVVIVPYRNTPGQDRDLQLKRFVEHFKSLKHGPQIVVVEQHDQQPGIKFNRGALLNIGAELAIKKHHADLLIFHDVDLYPSQQLVNDWYYKIPGKFALLHLASLWTTKYSGFSFVGGVTSCSPEVWQKSKFPNHFWGWGGEDDAWRDEMIKNNQTIFKLKYGAQKSSTPASAYFYDEYAHILTQKNPDWTNQTKREDRELARKKRLNLVWHEHDKPQKIETNVTLYAVQIDEPKPPSPPSPISSTPPKNMLSASIQVKN